MRLERFVVYQSSPGQWEGAGEFTVGRWSGEEMTKEEAKRYVREYRR